MLLNKYIPLLLLGFLSTIYAATNAYALAPESSLEIAASLKITMQHEGGSIELGEPLFADVAIQNSSKNDTYQLRVFQLGSADNPSPWEVSFEKSEFQKISQQSTSRSFHYDITIPPGQTTTIPAIVWHNKGRNSDLVLNKSGAWELRCTLIFKQAASDKHFQITTNTVKMNVIEQKADACLKEFSSQLGALAGDRVTVPMNKMTDLDALAKKCSSDLASQYYEWMQIRSSLSDLSWIDGLERRDPAAITAIEKYMEISRKSWLQDYSNTMISHDMKCLAAYYALHSGRFDDCKKLVEQLPEGYAPSWTIWLRNWVQDEEKKRGRQSYRS